MSSNLTIGTWDNEQDAFNVSATIHDPNGEHSVIAIYTPQSEQDVRNFINALYAKGLLRFENGHYVVTPAGEQCHNQLQTLLNMPPLEDKQS